MRRWSTGRPGQGVDHTLIARRRVDRRQRVCVPDLDGSVKTSRGQQVWIIRLKLAVKDCLNVTLKKNDNSHTNTTEQVLLSPLVGPACGDRQQRMEYQVSEKVPLLGAHVVEAYASIHEAANSLARRQREGLVLRQCWRRHRLTGGAGVLAFTGRARTLSCGRKVRRRSCSENQVI